MAYHKPKKNKTVKLQNGGSVFEYHRSCVATKSLICCWLVGKHTLSSIPFRNMAQAKRACLLLREPHVFGDFEGARREPPFCRAPRRSHPNRGRRKSDSVVETKPFSGPRRRATKVRPKKVANCQLVANQ